MNPQKLAHYAALCVEELDAHSGCPLSVQDISLRKGIPVAECQRVVQALENAGIVKLVAADQAVLIRQDITVLELLQAVWTRQAVPRAFRMLLGGHHASTTQTTRGYVLRSAESGREDING